MLTFNFVITVNKITYLSFFPIGNSLPSRYPKAASIYPGFPSDSVEHRPEGATDDFAGTSSYAYNQLSSTLNGIANRKGLLISHAL